MIPREYLYLRAGPGQEEAKERKSEKEEETNNKIGDLKT